MTPHAIQGYLQPMHVQASRARAVPRRNSSLYCHSAFTRCTGRECAMISAAADMAFLTALPCVLFLNAWFCHFGLDQVVFPVSLALCDFSSAFGSFAFCRVSLALLRSHIIMLQMAHAGNHIHWSSACYFATVSSIKSHTHSFFPVASSVHKSRL